MFYSIQNIFFDYILCISPFNRQEGLFHTKRKRVGKVMEIKDVLSRIGFVRNQANLSARELSGRMGMSPQYMAQVESGRIVLTVEKLLEILEICNFPIDRFFSPDINDYNIDKELEMLINALPTEKKKHIIEFIKN